MSVLAERMVATSEADVITAVRDATSDGVRLAVRGHGSLLDRLGGSEPGARVLSTAGLQGIIAHVPDDLIVTVRAGTSFSELQSVLAAQGQECPIEPDPVALDGHPVPGSVGGRLASALAGPRQLDAGRVRDWVLRVRFVAGDGQVITYGGVTVKDVTGYDLSRLMVGSWGSIGVLTEVTLKVRPIARHARWTVTDAQDADPIHRLHRPAGVLRDGSRTWVRLEGHPDDVAADMAACGLTDSATPVLPRSARLAVDPPLLAEVARRAREAGAIVVTQDGVGVAHLEGGPDAIATAREAAERAGGSLVALDPSLGLDPFGGARSLTGMATRVADGLDPSRVFAGRWRR
jgi:FAD/FMN-containing dehydrogenase